MGLVRFALWTALAFVILLAIHSGSGRAEGDAPRGEQSSQVSAQRFEDWELLCPSGEAGDAAGTACRLQQAQAVGGGNDVVFLFNVVLQQGNLVAIISTPLGVYLPAGLELKVDGGTARTAVFESCNASGCHAGFALTGSLLSSLKKGSRLVVTIQDTKATRVPVQVSLKGISAGLQALAETRKPAQKSPGKSE